jgi:hypothetical protein
MSKYTVMVPSADEALPIGSPPYASLDDALRGAMFLLGNGAALAWIVDEKRKLILPADQVTARLASLPTWSRSSIQTKATPGFNYLGL